MNAAWWARNLNGLGAAVSLGVGASSAWAREWVWVGICAAALVVNVACIYWLRPRDAFSGLEFDDFDMEDREDCDYCHGEGVVVTCFDDLCAGEEECIHGDGYGPCPECRGRGFHVVPWEGSA